MTFLKYFQCFIISNPSCLVPSSVMKTVSETCETKICKIKKVDEVKVRKTCELVVFFVVNLSTTFHLLTHSRPNTSLVTASAAAAICVWSVSSFFHHFMPPSHLTPHVTTFRMNLFIVLSYDFSCYIRKFSHITISVRYFLAKSLFTHPLSSSQSKVCSTLAAAQTTQNFF